MKLIMEEKPPIPTLIIRHLPKELERQEVIDLICHFGASSVRPMGSYGAMKYTAFAQFASQASAEKCLKRLHQLEVLGHKLIVEFAKSDQSKHFPTGLPDEGPKVEKKEAKMDDSHKVEEKVEDGKEAKDDIFSKHGIDFPRKPTLCYLYPPPTVSTLTNIANALASHPKFYTQVLHLMNKMNLPCPFGTVTASPPIAMDAAISRGAKSSVRQIVTEGEIQDIEMEELSSEESEIESDPENKQMRKQNANPSIRRSQKRPRKRMKLVQPDMSMLVKPSVIPKTSEVFENVDTPKGGPITFKLSDNIVINSSSFTENDAQTDTSLTVIEGGFGKVEPPKKPAFAEDIDKPDVNYKIDPSLFLSRSAIEKTRLKSEQIREFSVFKNYSAGEPSSRLYIKNLTKQTSEQDLVNLFGRYVDWSLEDAADLFDIRLMKEGRMKGQAFVTLPDEHCAKMIVKECNGFVLNGKPVVIQFARSAKAKQVDVLSQDD